MSQVSVAQGLLHSAETLHRDRVAGAIPEGSSECCYLICPCTGGRASPAQGAWKSVPAPATVIHTSMDTLPHSPTTARVSLCPDSKPFAPAEYHREPLWNQFFRLQPYKAKGGDFGPVCVTQRSPSAGQELLEILCCTSQCSALSTRTKVAWQCSQQENHILTGTLQSYRKKKTLPVPPGRFSVSQEVLQ
ncbi:uncharacterized protein ACIBXB_018442 isoform 5-T6 [Morphnus guianensis]